MPLKFARMYLERNPDADETVFEHNLARLSSIQNAQIGIINLDDGLDIETISEIFIRINSKGVPLSSADFAMSKIATYGDRGRNLRKSPCRRQHDARREQSESQKNAHGRQSIGGTRRGRAAKHL